jgi:hypothetical protein
VSDYNPITEEQAQAMSTEEFEHVREVRPWDLILPGTPRAKKDIAFGRYEMCKECDRFNPHFKTCMECGCFMKAKTHLAEAHCPLGKWGPVGEWGQA